MEANFREKRLPFDQSRSLKHYRDLSYNKILS
jgi:hypothetical protein